MDQGDRISPLLAPSPRFDFSEVIVGKINPNIVDASIIKEHFDQPTQVEFIETRVGRARRPRRALTGPVAWDDRDEANGKALSFSPIKLSPFAPPSVSAEATPGQVRRTKGRIEAGSALIPLRELARSFDRIEVVC
jgi:hypothetical protein